MSSQRVQRFRAATEQDAYLLVVHRGGARCYDVGLVAPKSVGDPHAGRWLCLSCRKIFDNQIQKDIHVGGRRRSFPDLPGGARAPGERAMHVLAWLSFESGKVEVP